MLMVTERSKWTFDTSGTAGLGVGFVAAEGGVIKLSDPQQHPVNLKLAALGVGVSAGLKLPKIGKLPVPKIKNQPVGGAVAPTFFPNAGWIWKTAACHTPDLTHEDFCGPTIFGEIGASVIIAGTGNAMLLGFDRVLFAEMMATSGTPVLGAITMDRAMSSVKAVLVSAGIAVSPSAQVGAAAFTGYIW